MALAVVLAVTLASLGSCSRLAEQDQVEPHFNAASRMDEASAANNTDGAEDEFGSKCCCYHPFFN
eukprot:406084-Amphidinium_carterae.1